MDTKKVLAHELVYLMVWMLAAVTILNPLIVMILSPTPTGIPPRYLEILGDLLSLTDREWDIYWFSIMIPYFFVQLGRSIRWALKTIRS